MDLNDRQYLRMDFTQCDFTYMPTTLRLEAVKNKLNQVPQEASLTQDTIPVASHST